MHFQPPGNDNINNGLTIQSTETPSHPTVTSGEPEDFYRASATNVQDTESTSPADSQAPIMNSWKIAVQNDNDAEGKQPATPEVNSAQQETQEEQEQKQFIPPVSAPLLPEPCYVNGEVGLIPTSEPASDAPQLATFPVPPLSAGLKTPGTTPEEQRIADLELKAQLEDRRDLAVKLKVRLAKVVLRSLHFCCSLVVLALVSSTFSIFFATRHLPTRNNLPPWDPHTPQWPQICILVIASLSLLLSTYILYCYWKGGHSRAERLAVHATIFTCITIVFTVTIWSVGIGIMQGSRNKNDGKDLWGWSCKDNPRKSLFQDTVNYTLVCRQQDWVIVCAIIELVLEFFTILVFIFAFYRLVYTKRNLRKSLNVRDEARSSLWIAKLKSQREKDEIQDEATTINTTYNHLNSNTEYTDAEEGRAVPILQSPPPAPFKRGSVGEEPLAAPTIVIPAPSSDIPSTPRSVSFQVPPRPQTSESIKIES